MPDLTLSNQTVIKLLERASPDPCEPYGCDPGEYPPEPPDPPPLESPQALRSYPQPRRLKGHWRSASVARMAISQSLSMHELAEVLAPDSGKRAVDLIQRKVSDLVDDWCGTQPHPKPYPWPWGPIIRSTEKLQPIELIVAGAQFSKGGRCAR